MNIVTIGGATQDVCVYFKNQKTTCANTPEGKQRFLLLAEGAKIDLESVAYFPGGGAQNTAVSYARQGFTTQIVCCIGNDCQGAFIIENLKKNNVAPDYVIHAATSSTGFSIVIPLESGDRTVLVNRGANLDLTAADIPAQALACAQQLYITSLTGSTAKLLPELALKAHKLGIPIAANPGSSQLRTDAHHLRHALPMLDILILNSYEATLLMPALMEKQKASAHIPPIRPLQVATAQLPCLLRKDSCLLISLFCTLVHRYGTKIVAITNGAEGVYVSKENCLYFYPSRPIRVVSTLGAGDAFGSGFVGHLMRGGSIEEAIRYGIANSHSVISHCGAQTGLLSLAELTQAAQALDERLLQKYSLA